MDKKPKKNPRFEDDNWVFRQPDEKKIVCKDCKHRAPDAKLTSGAIVYGCTKDICEKFPDLYGPGKPNGVLFKNADCKFYEKGPSTWKPDF